MFNHWKNTLKAHQHISYCSIQRDHFKKTILIQNPGACPGGAQGACPPPP